MQRGDAERDVEAALGERQPLAVRLNPQVGDGSPLEEAAATEADHGIDDEVARHVLAAARQEVLRRPALRRADLEHPVSAAHVALEQQPEAVLGCAPRAVLPAELRVQVRESGVDAVVGLVPALLLRQERPRGDLPELRLEAGGRRIEQPRDAVVELVAPSATRARQRAVELAAAGRTAHVARQLHDATLVGEGGSTRRV